jgi:serine/threonine protein kinase
LKHENIIQVIEAFLFDETFNLVLEYVSGIDLSQLIEKKQTTTDVIKTIFHMILAVEYIHTKHLFHGNLKLQNVIILENGSIKIDCFRLSGSDNHDIDQYTAPELRNSQENSITKPSDVWSLGICILELLGETIPFNKKIQKIILSTSKKLNLFFPQKEFRKRLRNFFL